MMPQLSEKDRYFNGRVTKCFQGMMPLCNKQSKSGVRLAPAALVSEL